MNLDCNGACPSGMPFKAEQAIAAADKATLIHALRAFATVRLWMHDEEELREALRVAILTKEAQDFEVYQALTGGQ